MDGGENDKDGSGPNQMWVEINAGRYEMEGDLGTRDMLRREEIDGWDECRVLDDLVTTNKETASANKWKWRVGNGKREAGGRTIRRKKRESKSRTNPEPWPSPESRCRLQKRRTHRTAA